jgi:hypothetical protein
MILPKESASSKVKTKNNTVSKDSKTNDTKKHSYEFREISGSVFEGAIIHTKIFLKRSPI